MRTLSKLLNLSSAEDIYEELICLGKSLPEFPSSCKLEENLVKGCQSIMYLSYFEKDGKLEFFVDSEGLISKGIAALCILAVYDKTAEEILNYPFEELKKIQLPLILSPSRSNGLKALIQKIKFFALKAYLEKKDQ
ncbi:MAG: SufE family protein [Chlamydiae bacterium]|nr:SufE family protein [Chlamydiota bacterium]